MVLFWCEGDAQKHNPQVGNTIVNKVIIITVNKKVTINYSKIEPSALWVSACSVFIFSLFKLFKKYKC